MRKVNAVQDNDSDWYVIPNHMVEDFTELCERMSIENEFTSKAEEIFTEKFSEYATGGDLNLIQLYIPEPYD
jgi:hypothetical protein